MFSKRAVVVCSVPRVIRGVYKNAMRVALEEVARGIDERSEARMTRGWKLFLLLPRLLLWKPVRGGLVSKNDLELRFRSFQTGQWCELLNTCASTTAKIHQTPARRGRHQREETVERRAIRALSRVNLGDPRTHATLRALTDPDRRPPMPRRWLRQEIERWEPEHPFSLDGEMLLTCLRKTGRGAAAGPSGMTADHLFPIWENERDSGLFVQAATSLARGSITEVIMEAIRLEQMTALRKPEWRREGDRRWRHCPSAGREDDCQTGVQASRKSHSLPVRPVNQSGMRVCRTHSAGDDRPRQSSNRGLHRWCRDV